MLKREALVRLCLKGGKEVELGPQTSIRLRIFDKKESCNPASSYRILSHHCYMQSEGKQLDVVILEVYEPDVKV